MKRLENKVAIITGGASGIGDACVRAFAAAGYRVAFGDLHVDKGSTLQKKIEDDIRTVAGAAVKYSSATNARSRRSAGAT